MSTEQHEAVKAELYEELLAACAHLLDNWRENQNLTVPVQNIARTMDAINLWNGPRLCNVAPESCSIDNETGEHIDDKTGARTKEHPAPGSDEDETPEQYAERLARSKSARWAAK